MTEDRILSHSMLVCYNDDPFRRFPFYGYHVVVMKGDAPGTMMLEIFDTGLGLTGSPPLYSCAINPKDRKGYPLIMFPMGKPGVSKVELLDVENAHSMGFNRERATYSDGNSEFALSFTVDPYDGRVAPFIVPGRDLHKVREFAPYANADTVLMPMREVTHHTGKDFGTSFDGQMLRLLARRKKREAPIAAGVRHACADAIIAIREEHQLMRQDIREMLKDFAANLMHPTRATAAGAEGWVVHPKLAGAC